MGYSKDCGIGRALFDGLFGRFTSMGKTYVVCPTTDPNYDKVSQIVSYDPDGALRLYPTLQTLITADPFVEGGNDVVILAGYDIHVLTSAWALSKSRVHVYGLDWLLGDKKREGQSSKIQVSTGAVADVLHLTGVRCSFHVIKFIQASTNAAALGVVTDAGESCLFEDCSGVFAVADNLGSTSAHELNFNGDTSRYVNCAFGTTQLTSTVARQVVNVARVSGSASGDAAKNFEFNDCLFHIQSTSASSVLFKVANTNAVKFNNRLVNCKFEAAIVGSTSAITLDNAIGSISGLTEGNIVVINPATNCTKVCAGVTDNIKVVGAATNASTGVGSTPS